MKPRKFHINKFPQDRIFVLFGTDYRIKLFSIIKEKYGFAKFNQLFNGQLNYSTFKQWQRGKTNFKLHFIPLWFIIRLSELFNMSIKEIEMHIVAYKGPSSSAIVSNPNLPLVEDERLTKILAHMLGDGYVGGAFGTGLPKGKTHSEYRNFEPSLLDQFEKDLSVFGEIQTMINYEHGHIVIPTVVGYLLKHIYQINFDCFNSEIPESLYDLPLSLVASFIRAFGDDEAHVYDTHIDFYSANKRLLCGLMNLIQMKFPNIKLSEMKVNYHSKNPKYYFYVLSESRGEFFTYIGFDHNQKQEDLIFNIQRCSVKQCYQRNRTKDSILKCLAQKPATAKQLSRKIGVSHGQILGHLNQLKKETKVQVVGKEKISGLWALTK